MSTTAADRPVDTLVADALAGDEGAWRALVDRYATLVWSVCRAHRLSGSDADDVSQTVFLRLVEHLPEIRQAAALPGWIRTTARRECLRTIADAGRTRPAPEWEFERPTLDDELDADLLAAEKRAALRDAFDELSERCRELLGLLLADRPIPYAEIAARQGISVGSIGPTRGRCLDRLRESPALASYLSDNRRESSR